MLRRLSIRNFAIIEHLEQEFHGGLSVLTGETGAGKSIIIGALNLLMGGRASAELVRSGFESATVAAWFDRPEDAELERRLEELGLGAEAELVFRREIRAEGRSRAWLNDRPVSVGVLGEIAARFVDISGQHQHQSLLRTENHLFLLDRFARLDALRETVSGLYAELLLRVRERERLLQASKNRREREDYLAFQVSELEKADPKAGEEAALEGERGLLRNAEKIRENLQAALSCFESDPGLSGLCLRAERYLERGAEHAPEIGTLASRLGSARLELEDVEEALARFLGSLDADPGRLDEVEERLARLSRLGRKHGCTADELPEKLAAMRRELSEVRDVDDILEEMDARIRAASEAALAEALKLSEKRRKAAKTLSGEIEGRLSGLGMARARFRINVSPRAEGAEDGVSTRNRNLCATGLDEVEFLFGPNVGEALKSLAKIASGGELSRVMLAIKSVLLDLDPVELSVFDEADAGISGAVAQEVGARIRELSERRQVVCITHLPQVAAWASRHYRVEKTEEDGRTFTRIVDLLEKSDRVAELARLMSGSAAGNAARKAAEELLRRSSLPSADGSGVSKK